MTSSSVANNTSASTSSWYLASASQDTFAEALSRFKEKLASRSANRAWTDGSHVTRLEDVVEVVVNAQKVYNKKKGDSRMSKNLLSFSRRIAYYGQVLDVMVQHHPEYVSLAWGSMKILFGAVIEHEKIGSTIVIALNDIGDALSRLALAESLYPTAKMKSTIVTLNCYIITFLCRALDWFESSSFSRAVQSIARPAALRYDDLIKDIHRTLAQVTDLSVAGSQAEQRDMHETMRAEHVAQQNFRTFVQTRFDEMQHQLDIFAQRKSNEGDLKAVYQQMKDLTTLVHDISKSQSSSESIILQELVVMKQDIQKTQVDISHQLTDVQFNQALVLVSNDCRIDHKAAYEYAILLRKVRRTISNKHTPFWNSQKLHTWDRSPSHSYITLSTTFRERLSVRDFYVGVIEQLLESDVTVFWIIQKSDDHHNVFEVLKSLILQALGKVASPHTDTRMSTWLRSFNAATSIHDYTVLLVQLVSHFNSIYIIVDANAMSPDAFQDCRAILHEASQLLRERNQHSVLKVMLVGTGLPTASSGCENEALIKVVPTSKRKGKKIPKSPLRGRKRAVVDR